MSQGSVHSLVDQKEAGAGSQRKASLYFPAWASLPVERDAEAHSAMSIAMHMAKLAMAQPGDKELPMGGIPLLCGCQKDKRQIQPWHCPEDIYDHRGYLWLGRWLFPKAFAGACDYMPLTSF